MGSAFPHRKNALGADSNFSISLLFIFPFLLFTFFLFMLLNATTRDMNQNKEAYESAEAVQLSRLVQECAPKAIAGI